MDKKTIIIFNESENLLKGSLSIINIINNHLTDLLKKHNCCNDLIEKANGYSELYNDIIAKYNNLLKQAKTTKSNNIKLSNEISSLHKFIKMLSDDLFSLDKKIMERSNELLKYTNKEEKQKMVGLYNLPSVPKHKPITKGGKRKKRKTKKRKTKKRKTKKRKTKKRKKTRGKN